MKRFLLCAILLGGCAAATPLPPLPDARPVQAQFGLRFTYESMSLPLQGAVQMADNAGSLGVIFPHGLTLGVCRYQGGGMECVPAGASGKTRFILRQIGLAVYRMLPALMQESPIAEQAGETGWSVRRQETEAGRSAIYRDPDRQVTVEMHLMELTRP
jgi:hypothetical protein